MSASTTLAIPEAGLMITCFTGSVGREIPATTRGSIIYQHFTSASVYRLSNRRRILTIYTSRSDTAGLQRSFAHLPISHRNLQTAWSHYTSKQGNLGAERQQLGERNVVTRSAQRLSILIRLSFPGLSTNSMDQGGPHEMDSFTASLARIEADPAGERHRILSSVARERTYNPPVDLRLLDFVTSYDTNLMCPICRCPFVDPVALVECGHCFCRDCIRQAWDANSDFIPLRARGTCPTCRTPAKPDTRSATTKILVNMTDDLVVKCPRSELGCRAHIKRGEVEDHVAIYCGYAMVECGAEDCQLPVLRKDAESECLHYDVSCLSCQKPMQKWKLDIHWRSECPERVVQCRFCNSTSSNRLLEEHINTTCPEAEIPCPGAAFGCNERGRRPHTDEHVKTCVLAKLAPTLERQQKRLEEHEAAQKQLLRKLEVLQTGFASIQSILYPSRRDERHLRSASFLSEGSDLIDANLPRRASADGMDVFPPTREESDPSVARHSRHQSLPIPGMGSAPPAPGPRPNDIPDSFTTDFDLEAPASFPPPDTNGGPYASPLHHLLSMHESLRDEISRISTALSELDGRHSMQNLNENLRTREEISYLGAQVGGLQRQVHWLTSSQLQRQHRSPTPGSSAGAVISDAAAGAGVEAAVSAVSTAASTALRGAARMMSGSGPNLRRGPSEEGRTKL